MGRSPCCEKVGLKKGPWTPEEDQKLLSYIEEHGHGNWRALPTKAGLERCGKSCRLRWTNYLRPDIKRGKFSLQEEQTIIQLHALLGNRWSAIATHLPKRTDNEIKNYWNTHLKKRLSKMGIDPVTHKPKNDTLGVSSSSDDSGGGAGAHYSKSAAANLSHMAQWESARLEAEARLVRQSKLRCNSSITSSALMLNNNFNNHNAAVAAAAAATTATTTFITTNSSNPDDAVLPYPTSSSASASASASSSSSRCLDVLRAWQYEPGTQFWHNSNDKISSSSGTGGVVGSGEGEEEERGTGTNTSTTTNTATTTTGPHHHSPTSTLSFSENGPSSAVAPQGATSATMIEFMGGNNSNNNHNDYSAGKMMMMMAKENAAKISTSKGSSKGEGEEEKEREGKGDRQQELSWKPNHSSPDHDQYNDGILNNSMSITSVPHQQNNVGTLSVHHHHDQEDHHIDDDNANPSYEFMDGFTELLLSNFTSHRQPNFFMDCEGEDSTNNNHNNNNNNTAGCGAGAGAGNRTDNGNGGTSTTTTDHFYDDNSKSYWNSILHLVDSSPSSNSPLF